MRRTTVVAMLTACLISTNAVAASLISCEQIKQHWRQMAENSSFEEWTELYERAFYDSDCGGDVVAEIGHEIVERELSSIQRAYAASNRPEALRELLDRLDQIQEYGKHWQFSMLQGEILRKLRQPRSALGAYRSALLQVESEELTPLPPPVDQIALLRNRLDEVAAIVAQIDPAAIGLPVNRNGDPIGQYSFSTRGFARQKALVPIQFEFGTDRMTGVGQSSLVDVWKTLNGQGSPNITVVGHTDPVGSAVFNMDLSINRAAAVKRELLARGYRGNVTTIGRGEEQPFIFDDPGLYTEEQRHQAHRRVELVLR